MATKQAFGNGYGTHRGHHGDKALGLSVPAHASGGTRKPGSNYSRSDVGRSGKKHFAGAKLFKSHAS